MIKLTKTEKYFKELQKVAIKEQGYPEKYLIEIDNFLNTQTILKRNKIKRKSELIKIYFIEYINLHLEEDYYENNKGEDIFTFLYYKISEVCLKQKDIATDEIVASCILGKKDKINSIIIEGYTEKQRRVKELKEEIRDLTKGGDNNVIES